MVEYYRSFFLLGSPLFEGAHLTFARRWIDPVSLRTDAASRQRARSRLVEIAGPPQERRSGGTCAPGGLLELASGIEQLALRCERFAQEREDGDVGEASLDREQLDLRFDRALQRDQVARQAQPRFGERRLQRER